MGEQPVNRKLRKAIQLRRWVRVALAANDLRAVARLSGPAERAYAALDYQSVALYLRWAHK